MAKSNFCGHPIVRGRWQWWSKKFRRMMRGGMEWRIVGSKSSTCKYEYCTERQMVTKNERGREENSISDSVWHCGDRGLFAI